MPMFLGSVCSAIVFSLTSMRESVDSVRVFYSDIEPFGNIAACYIPINGTAYAWRNATGVARRDLGQSFLAEADFLMDSFSVQAAGTLSAGAASAVITVKIFESTSINLLGTRISAQSGRYLSSGVSVVAGGWITFDMDDVALTAGKYYTVVLSFDAEAAGMQQNLYDVPAGTYVNGREWYSADGETILTASTRDLAFIVQLKPKKNIPLSEGVINQPSGNQIGAHIGSPSILILPDGTYLAAHDWFDISPVYTEVFRSTDRGASWSHLASIPYVHFASLFWHDGFVYLMGTSVNKSPGYITIHRSADGAFWTSATDENTGKLLIATVSGQFSCAPTPVIVAGGRVWRAFSERMDPNSQGYTDFRIFFMSAPVNSDLLLASSWTRSNGVGFNSSWINAKFPGWLEPNAVEYPAGSGNVLGICRLDTWLSTSDSFAITGYASGNPRYGLAAAVAANSPTRAGFNYSHPDSWLNFPGGQSKFTIRYDSQSGKYWSVINKITHPHAGTVWLESPMHQRNVLKLVSSADMQTWTEHATLIRWKEGESLANTGRTGFHYADWQFDGEDIVYVVRNGWNANTYHDANRFTFHRIKDFRNTTVVAPDRGACVFTTNSVGAYDGYVLEYTAGSGMGGSVQASLNSGAALRAGDDAANRQYRTVLYFNTAGLPENAVITSAMLKLCRGGSAGANPFNTLGPCTVDIRNSSFSGAAALTSNDFSAAASAYDISEVGNPLNMGGWAFAPINTDGLQYINKTGGTQFRVYFATSTDSNATENYVGWYSGEATAANRPKLEVTYEYKASFTSIAGEDGYVIESSETSNIGGHIVSASAGNDALRAGDDQDNRQYKTILSFDTSSLPDGAVITSARLKMTRGSQSGNPFETLGRCPVVDIKNGSFGASGLEKTDFEAAASVTRVALLSNATADGDTATAEIDISGLGSINKTGRTQFRIYFTTGDDDDSAYDYQAWYSGEHATYAPVLDVTYQ